VAKDVDRIAISFLPRASKASMGEGDRGTRWRGTPRSGEGARARTDIRSNYLLDK